MMRQNSRSVKSKITNFQTTNEQFYGRVGLAPPVSRYLDEVGITEILAKRVHLSKKEYKRNCPELHLSSDHLLFF
jgi:hypothetical protein